MKQLACVVAVLLAVITAYFVMSSDTQTVTNYPGDGTTIVAFGDSLIQGVGATGEGDLVSQLENSLDEPIVNLGVAGDTTRDALERLDTVLQQDPKLVILLFGGNDYLQKIPSEETFANLDTLITEIHQSGTMVLLLGIRGGVLRDHFKDSFVELADTHNVAHVPNVLDGLLGNPSLMDDSVHPNNLGYTQIADRIQPVLVELLN